MNQLAPSQEKTTQEAFNEIELTEDEIEEALRKGREEKYYRLKREKYWEDVSNEPEIMNYTAKELYVMLKQAKNPSGQPVVIDNDNKEIARLLCLYFSGNPDFEKAQDFTGAPYNLSKGLCLMGNVGVGKTFLMGFFAHNQRQSYVIANCRKIEGRWVEEMSMREKPQRGVIEHYSAAIPTAVNANAYRHTSLGVCFDDLGTETSPSKAYGEEKNVLAEILMNRYESGLPMNWTHITTNLSAHDIGIKYSTRVKDRFREMFNLIQFDNNAKSRRK